MLKKTLTATATAAALAVGLASPALAGNDLRLYIENDKDYVFSANMTVALSTATPFQTDGTLAAPKGPGDACPEVNRTEGGYDSGWGFTAHPRLPFGVTVPSGDHQYVCFTHVPTADSGGSSTYKKSVGPEAAGGGSVSTYVSMKDGTATTPGGSVFPMFEGTELNWRVVNPDMGYMYLANEFDDSSPTPWFFTQLGKATDGYNLVMKLDWDAPVVQEAQLMSLMDITPDDCTIVGTAGDDVLTGTDGDDVICGLGGDDVIDGRGGDDVIKGGAGDDQMRGGDGDDVMGGGPGDDQMDGGSGDDAMRGGTGGDILVGGDGHDLADGGSGEDVLLPDANRADASATLGMSWLGDSRYDYQQKQARSMTSAARYYLRGKHIHDLATTDSLGNFMEDGNGDGVSAQQVGSVGSLPCEAGFFNPDVSACVVRR